jgi:hypothetical protein
MFERKEAQKLKKENVQISVHCDIRKIFDVVLLFRIVY